MRGKKAQGKRIANLQEEIHRMKIRTAKPKRIAKQKTRPTKSGSFRMSSSNPSSLRLVHSERWTKVVSLAADGDELSQPLLFTPGVSGLTRLDQLSGMYDNYILRKAIVHYKPAVGTTVDGELLMGVDYDSVDLPSNADGLQVLEPRSDGPVYKERVVAINCNRAMKAKWHYTVNSPGITPRDRANQNAFCVVYRAASETVGKQLGNIWVDYDIELVNPQPPSLTSSQNQAIVQVAARVDTSSAASGTAVVEDWQTSGSQQSQGWYTANFGSNGTNPLGEDPPDFSLDVILPDGYAGNLAIPTTPFSFIKELDSLSREVTDLEASTRTWIRKGQVYLLELAASWIKDLANGNGVDYVLFDGDYEKRTLASNPFFQTLYQQGLAVLQDSAKGLRITNPVTGLEEGKTSLVVGALKDIARGIPLSFPIRVGTLNTPAATKTDTMDMNLTLTSLPGNLNDYIKGNLNRRVPLGPGFGLPLLSA